LPSRFGISWHTMIQTLSPGRSDPPLGQRVRPRRSHGRLDLFDSEPSNAALEFDPEPAVPVTDEIPRRIPIPATGVNDLLGRPVGGGMSGTKAQRLCRACRAGSG